MRIGIDFDCTLTKDLPLFMMFIRGAKANGHDVRIVTYRHPDNRSDDIDVIAERLGIEIIFTDHMQKEEFCDKLGWTPDIWIDDKPIHIPTPCQLVERIKKINEESGDDMLWLPY